MSFVRNSIDLLGHICEDAEKRPMLWTLLGVATLLAWGLSTGEVLLGTGSATVGGRQAWITSEFSKRVLSSASSPPTSTPSSFRLRPG